MYWINDFLELYRPNGTWRDPRDLNPNRVMRREVLDILESGYDFRKGQVRKYTPSEQRNLLHDIMWLRWNELTGPRQRFYCSILAGFKQYVMQQRRTLTSGTSRSASGGVGSQKGALRSEVG